ncbi:MAG TPA: glycerophosphodiester phosphodiesterase family protein [Kofleriaceae bacterium]|nr:glycerophosphodiester phosphodiesterase family protein [Kofleriaceae bacterium]
MTAAPRLAAHRGATSQAPENSLAAIRLAFERGADGVEVDVRLSADRVPVLCHDEDTRRMAGVARPVAEQTAAELAALDLGGGERIPTLREALAIVPAGKTLWLDLKVEPGEVEAVLAAVPRGAPVMLQAFSLPVLAQALVGRPDLPGYLLAAGRRDEATGRRGPVPLAAVEQVRATGIAGLAVDHQGITDELLAEVGRAGVALYVWTYPDPDSARRSAPAGAVWTEAEF